MIFQYGLEPVIIQRWFIQIVILCLMNTNYCSDKEVNNSPFIIWMSNTRHLFSVHFGFNEIKIFTIFFHSLSLYLSLSPKALSFIYKSGELLTSLNKNCIFTPSSHTNKSFMLIKPKLYTHFISSKYFIL